MVLQQILDTAGIDHRVCADTLGLGFEVFAEMLSGQREIPESMVPVFSATLGVHPDVLTARKRQRPAEVTPAIWFRLRAPELTDADREYVLIVRRLAYFLHEVEEIKQVRAQRWKVLFESIRRIVDPQASPTEQGRLAARLFRDDTGLRHGLTPIAESLRGAIRSLGILVFEAAVHESQLEGCSFYVGPAGRERPCLFANSYKTTWFRRNDTLLHEAAHAIFDVESAIASLDFADRLGSDDVTEQRANAFAQECLVPSDLLRAVGQRLRIDWSKLTRRQLAELVAETGAEQRLVLKAAAEAGLISDDRQADLMNATIGDLLPGLTDRALTTEQFVRKVGKESAPWLSKRSATTSPRTFLLPSRFVADVEDLYRQGLISRGKAARMLMIEEADVDERFPLADEGEV